MSHGLRIDSVMTISIIQQSTPAQSGGQHSLTSSTMYSVTTGNTLVVCCFGWSADYQNFIVVTDTNGHIYQTDILYPASDGMVLDSFAGIWHASNVTGGNIQVTMTAEGSGSPFCYWDFVVFEVSNIVGTPDATGDAGGTYNSMTMTAGNPTSGTITTTQPNDIIFAVFSEPYGDGTVAVFQPEYYTGVFSQFYNGTNQQGGIAYQIVSSIQTSQTLQWTVTGSTTAWYGVTVAFTEWIPPPPTVLLDTNTGLPIIINGLPAVPTITQY